MSSKKKINSIAKTTEEESTEKSVHVPSIELNNEPVETTYDPEQDLDIVFIPNNLHEHFECVIGKHVFIDKPWAKISRKKIMDHLQSQNSNSCFWKFRKKLEGVQNENILVGYKPFSSTDEEFLICTTDRAKQYVEETQMDREIKQKVERSVFRVPGPWESKSSEKDIEEIKPVQTREKITYKWKLPSERLQAKAELEDSNSKSMKNNYVKLEPRPKEVFEISDAFTTDSSVQAVRKTVNREMQTIPRIKDNKCIQSVAVDEEMFQLQPLTKPDKALDDFLEKHVPNLVNELHYNELYDLYRDDYKLLKNENEKPIEQNSKVIKLLPGYQNVVSQKKFVSCHTWHPTIPGVFAVSYTVDSNALYKSVSLEVSVEETTKSTAKYEKYGISYSDDENNQESLSDQTEVYQLVDENYDEKIMCLLNKEYVRRMRTIQVTDEEKTHEYCSEEINRQLRNAFIHHDPLGQSSTHQEIPSENAGLRLNLEPSAAALLQQRPIETDDVINLNAAMLKELNDEILINDENNIILDVTQNESNLENELSAEENGYEERNRVIKETKDSTRIMPTTNTNQSVGVEDEVEHHDSDTESFYNIWGDDGEWMYGNELRNAVRTIHRKFNQKHDREAREEKLFRLLKSEAKYSQRKNKLEDMDKERMKLTKDMFEAGVMYQKLKSQLDSKSKKRRKSKQNKQYKAQEHNGEFFIGPKTTPITDEQNNSVVIWSVNDNIFPKLRLECTEEVRCVEFNPRHGNTVVGGLKNGQICIWDITGKLENLSPNDLNKTEKEKKHHKHLWTHMKWSLDVDFKTRIRPAALSAILESHESAVTAIQWIHPMNEITPLGKLITVQEGRFSDQFFSASMDGTIRLWDLHSTPLQPKLNENNPTVNIRSERPENLNSYKSPLSAYNNRLKPSYTIEIKEPENAAPSPVTAMSFEIPLMRYKRISDQRPLQIGKRQFEFVPAIPDEPNRILVVGGITGQIGVVTWTGHDSQHQQGRDKEDCKHVWWGHVHDGPINCIRRNVFYRDVHLVSGGHVVSIWSLNYKGGPVWWKRFDDFTNSVLWSTVHPAEFRVSFNTGGVLQFWNFMKYTHQPYYTSDIFLSDGLIATLSAPRPPIHFVDAERFEFAGDFDELVLDHGKNEPIGFSDSAGTITIIIADATAAPGPAGTDEVGRVFQKEVDWRNELDAWNEGFREEFAGTAGYDDGEDEHEPARRQRRASAAGSDGDVRRLATSARQRDANVFDEMFKWFSGRDKNQRTRVGKMRERYAEREKQYMIEALMKKKNVSQKQLEEHFKRIEGKKNADDDVSKIHFEADETYRDIVNKLIDSELHTDTTKEYSLDIDSKGNTDSENMKQTIDKIQQLLVTDCEAEKDKLNDFIKNNPYIIEQEDWDQVIELAERQVRDTLNDPTLLKNPALRMMRRKLAKKYIDEGYKIKEWKSRKDEHECDRYKIRERKIEKLKAMYGKSYNPYWDKGLRPQKMKDAIQMRVTDASDQHYKRSHDFEKDDSCYADYLSLVDMDSIFSHQDQSERELSVYNVSESVTQNNKLDEPINKCLDTEPSKHRETKSKIQQSNIDYKEHHELETLNEQDQVEDNLFSKTSNELNKNNN